jgi:hypothetical protein
MPDLRVEISASAGGWRFQWHDDGVAAGAPVLLPTQAANQLGFVGSAIAHAFDDRGADGFARLPLTPVAALDDLGVQLREVCCGPVAATC